MSNRLKRFVEFTGRHPERIALPLLFILALAVRLDFLFASEFARGADGYYYAAQVKHYLERGSLFGSDSSLILRWLILFSFLVPGPDIVLSNKIAAALLGALLVPAAYLLGRNIALAAAGAGAGLGDARSGVPSGLLLAAFYTSVSPMVWFHLEFVKNLGGILFFTLFAAFLIKAFRGKPADIIAAGICLILTLLSHKLMGGFALIFAGASLAFAGASALRIRSARLFRLLLMGGAGLITLVIIAGLVFPGALAPADFSRFENLFTWPPRWHLSDYNRLIGPPAHHRLEFLLMAFSPLPVVGLFFADLFRGRVGRAWFLAGLFLLMHIICMNPILKFRGLDFSFRLLISIFAPAGALLIFALSRLPVRIASAGAYALVLCLAAYQMFAFRSFPIRAKVDYALYDKITPLLVLPKDSLLIVHQSLDNFYYYRESRDAFRFMPEVKHLERPVYRLAWGISRRDIRRWMPRDADLRFLPGRYVLMREKDWERFMNRLPRERRRKYRNWKNPHRFRPGFMRRGK